MAIALVLLGLGIALSSRNELGLLAGLVITLIGVGAL